MVEVYRNVMQHNVLVWSAGLAYQELFSLFPFLIFVRALIPYLPGVQALIEDATQRAQESLGSSSELYNVLDDYVFSQLSTSNGTVLWLSVIFALYSASAALATMIRAVNVAYGYPETRGYAHRRGLGVLLTLWLAILLPLSLFFMVLGPWVTDILARLLPGSTIYETLWSVLRWPLALVLPAAALTVLYHYGPAQRGPWRRIIPGSVVGVAGTVLVSVGFSWYLSSGVFAPGMLTYGVIGTAMVLLFWMYLVSASILVGGEVNAAADRRWNPVAPADGSGLAEAGVSAEVPGDETDGLHPASNEP